MFYLRMSSSMSLLLSAFSLPSHQLPSHIRMEASAFRRLCYSQLASCSLHAVSRSKSANRQDRDRITKVLGPAKQRSRHDFLKEHESEFYFTIEHHHMLIPQETGTPTRPTRTMANLKRCWLFSGQRLRFHWLKSFRKEIFQYAGLPL
jgi:hypothetical protein